MAAPDEQTSSALLGQVLAALNDLRKHVDIRLDSQDQELSEFRERLPHLATKEDLKQFITRDVADTRDTAHTQRQNAIDERQQRIEQKLDALREEQFDRELTKRTQEHVENRADEHRDADLRAVALQRANDRVWTIITLIGSPIIWIVLNYILTHH